MSINNNEKGNNKKSDHNFQVTGISVGLCLGVAFGLMFDNLAIGISVGLCLGLAIGTAIDKDKKDKDINENSDETEK